MGSGRASLVTREFGPKLLTNRQHECTFTVRQTQAGAIPDASGEQTPTGLARKRGTCRRFAVPQTCRLTVTAEGVARAPSRAMRHVTSLRRECNASSPTL